MIKAHLGCGNNIFDGWINVDIDGPADLKADLSNGIPFKDNEVDYIYSEHFIEHISRSQGVNFLKNCFNVLKNNGKIRIATPNLKIYCEDYLNNKIDRWGPQWWSPSSPCDMINEGFRWFGSHQYIYDESELRKVFQEAGFSDITAHKHRDSLDDNLRNLETRPNWEDLYMEAVKK